MTERKPRDIKHGNDFFKEIRVPELGRIFTATYWDLWIAIILDTQFDNNVTKMIGDLRAKIKKSINLRDEYEGHLNHILSLHQNLVENKLNFSDILQNTDADFIKKQKVKAKTKIIDMRFREHEQSTWMINTPRKLREEKAMYGYWHLFPVNPQPYANSLGKLYKNGVYTEDQSYALEDKLDKYLNKHKKKATDSELLALYRAFLSVVVYNMDWVDDSYGVISALYGDIFTKYFLFDRNKLEMPLADFFQDFLELIIWEDYGFTDYYIDDFFKTLSSTEIPLVQSILLQQKDELKSLDLDYQSKEAATLLKKLRALQR
ncbi:MAG: hypothetical protein GQ569_01830 [Methylococcaceae bacterium]|nr:hypothetical protein [Methylococcaceae bacterium]